MKRILTITAIVVSLLTGVIPCTGATGQSLKGIRFISAAPVASPSKGIIFQEDIAFADQAETDRVFETTSSYKEKPEAPLDSTGLWIDAGADSSLCLNGVYFYTWGDAANYSFLLWKTSGDGFFDDANTLNTFYYPGYNDIATGNFKFYLKGWSLTHQNDSIVDSVQISIVVAPSSNAGEDIELCEGSIAPLSGQAEHYASLLWSSTGDGYFSDATILNPVYVPGSEDIADGNAALCLVAYPISPCAAPHANCMNLDIVREPVVNAGSDTLLCETEVLQLEGFAAHHENSFWTTSGDGVFSDPYTVNPVYTPGDEDISAGTVELQFTATAKLPCLNDAVDQLTLTIQKNPVTSHVPSQLACGGQPVQLEAAASGFSSVYWITYGDGSFDNPSILNPVYNPGALDLSRGYVFLELNALPVSPCTHVPGSYILVNFVPEPQLTAAPDTITCAGINPEVSAEAMYYSDIEWITAGDGYFDSAQILNPVYYPGTDDIQNGQVLLQVQAFPLSPCEVVASDDLLVEIAPFPWANAGADFTTCDQAALQGEVANSSSMLWITTGDGSFSNATIPDPVYFAGEQDIENSSVELVLTAMPAWPCQTGNSDTVIYQIDIPEVINHQMDEQVLYAGAPLELAFEAASQLEGTYEWYLNGEIISGCESPALLVAEVCFEDAGTYHCTYNNGCYEIYSDTAMVVVYQQDTQQFLLSKGWSGISSYIQPENAEITMLLEPVVSDMIILTNDQGVYWPDENLNTIDEWFNNFGYRIKMREAATFSFTGWVRYPPAPLTITPGWSLFPVTTTEPMEIETVFADYPQVVMIKEVAGTKLYWPAMGIFTLEYLEPGKAYQVYNSVPDNLILILPPDGGQ
ncbi:MAG: immunoglobulin domain-containing protein [Bacteroidales bacterium]